MAEWLGLSLTWFYYGRETFLSKQEACPKEGIACGLQQHARAWPCQLCMCGRKSSHTDVWQQLPTWTLQKKEVSKGQLVWDSAGRREARGSACKCSAHKRVMSVFNIISVELQQWNHLTVASQNSQDSNGTPLLAAVGRNAEHLAVSRDQLSQHRLLPLKPSLLSWAPVSMWRSRPASDLIFLTVGKESKQLVCKVLHQEKPLSDSKFWAFMYLVFFLSPFNNT